MPHELYSALLDRIPVIIDARRTLHWLNEGFYEYPQEQREKLRKQCNRYIAQFETELCSLPARYPDDPLIREKVEFLRNHTRRYAY